MLAVRTCFSRMYSNPDLVMRSPRAFEKESRGLRLAAYLKPITKGRRCLLPQWKYPFAAAFAHYMNGRLRVENQIS